MRKRSDTEKAYEGRKGANACISGGYVYEFDGKRNWKRSSDERWETIVLGKKHCGRLLGTRRIDGSFVNVLKVRGKIYAALPHAFSSWRRQGVTAGGRG